MIEALKVFVCVLELESFSRAAEQLYVTQPTVSQQIRNLENDMGTKLLDRTSKYVKATEAGQIVYNKAKQILQTYEEAKDDIGRLHNVVSGALRIGASYSIGESILPKILSEYAIQFPLVDIKATIANTGDILQGVRKHDFEIGLVSEEIQFSDLKTEKLMDDEMVIILPSNHPLAVHEMLAQDHLQDHIWIFREKGSGTRAFTDGLIHDNRIQVKRSYEFSSSQAVKEAVSSGLGIALVSYWIVRKEIVLGDILVRRLKDRKLTRSFYIIHRKELTTTMAVGKLLEQLISFKLSF
jgi:DNA-binding transcriptional LysR family regulator